MTAAVISSLRMIIAILVLYLSISPSWAENWPQFRGPDGQGHSDAHNLPLMWDQESNVVWKKSLPGSGWSSPIVQDGRVYLTTAVADETETDSEANESVRTVARPHSLRALCIDYDSGDVVWDVPISELPEETSIHAKNSHASSTSVVTADRIYVHFGTHGTAALDPDGNIIWKKRIEYNPVHGSGSSPILFEDLLIFNCDGGESPVVMALDTVTGDERWKTARPEGPKKTFSFSTPLVIDFDGEPQLVSPGAGAVCSYHPRTGEQLWFARYPEQFSVVPRPVFAEGLVFVCTGYDGPAELMAIRPNGSGDVTDTHVAWRADQFVSRSPSPVVHEDLIYLMSDNGIASCRNLKSGELIWKERVGGNYSASPVLAEGKIYFMSEEGICTVIKAASVYEQLAKNDLREPTLASITPLDGTLLIRTAGSLYRIGK